MKLLEVEDVGISETSREHDQHARPSTRITQPPFEIAHADNAISIAKADLVEARCCRSKVGCTDSTRPPRASRYRPGA